MVAAITEFDPVKFDGSHCFLCFEKLVKDNRSDEHIFPKWIQRRHDLWNQKLHLLNGSLIPYRTLTIPCCKNCNNGPLSKLETNVQKAFTKKPSDLNEDDEKWLYLWSCKLLFGMLAKERGLLIDRSNPSQGTIIESNELERLRAIHCHLQAVRFSHEFSGPNCNIPGSVVVLESQECSKAKKNFDFCDDFVNFSIFIRTGNRVLFANFDGGLVAASIGNVMRSEAQKPLHPIQARELWAKFMYKTQLVEVIPFFLTKFDEERQHLKINILSYDHADNLSQLAIIRTEDYSTYIPYTKEKRRESLFRDWNATEYGYRLAAFTEVDPDFIFIDEMKTQAGTFLCDDNGKFKTMHFD